MKMSLPATTAHRVTDNTAPELNARIREETRRRVSSLAGDPEGIRRRIAELDREWDVERCLETGASTLTLTGIVLSLSVNRRWLLLSGVVQSFFLQHAIQGWCPPLPVLRHLGVRTAQEIEAERHALKALLGQYSGVEPLHSRHATAQRIFDSAVS